MPSRLTDDGIYSSVLDFVTERKFPDSEDVASAEFSSSILPEALQRVSKAREQAQKEISSLSEQTASDVDGWISQAKQLHGDIERSKLTARKIVAQHERTRPLQLHVEDAWAKVELLKTEITFNETLTEVLEKVRGLCHRLSFGQNAVVEGRLKDAIDVLEDVEKIVETSEFRQHSNLAGILLETASVLRSSIIEYLRVRWSSEVFIDRSTRQLQVNNSQDSSLYQTIQSLSHLGVLDSVINTFQKDMSSLFIDSVLQPRAFGQRDKLLVGDFGLRVEKTSEDATASEVVHELETVLGYLHLHLPSAISNQLSKVIVPRVSTYLIKYWLSSAIPSELAGLSDFETLLKRVLQFCETLDGFGWHDHAELISWINQVPRHWLTRRRVDALDQMRKLLISSKVSTRSVERTEKEMVSNENEVLLGTNAADDWDANWEGEDEEVKELEPTEPTVGRPAADEEDVRAWGLDDEDAEDRELRDHTNNPEDEEDAGDAWGWEDEEDIQRVPDPNYAKPVEVKAPQAENGHHAERNSRPREITLTERYTVTDIPDSVMGLIGKQISDSESIKLAQYSNSRVSSSGTGLLALPTLILAMFKAIAPSFYNMKLSSGQMYLYNDCMYLAEKIRETVESKQLSRLNADIEGLEKFGKASYSKEMQTQRTIISDLLDGVQGFSNCAEPPFLKACENAINATVDRILDVYKEWHSILSHSALLQAIGSLISTVIDKVIVDIEDLSDISETESQRLVSFCNILSKLENIFMPESNGDEEPVSMTAVYVTNWLKFQYLINILESSLADIKFLWVEGELPLEFSLDEVIDLIEALFAESDHRRKAIAEIRRTSRGV